MSEDKNKEAGSLSKILAGNLLSRRTLKKMTFNELGKRVGVSDSTINRLELGSVKGIIFEKIEKIAAGLTCEPYELFMPRDEDKVEKPLEISLEVLESQITDDDKRKRIQHMLDQFKKDGYRRVRLKPVFEDPNEEVKE